VIIVDYLLVNAGQFANDNIMFFECHLTHCLVKFPTNQLNSNIAGLLAKMNFIVLIFFCLPIGILRITILLTYYLFYQVETFFSMQLFDSVMLFFFNLSNYLYLVIKSLSYLFFNCRQKSFRLNTS